MKKLYSTTMTNTGGRAGTVTSPDGTLSFKMSAPGLASDATNPEQLFAAGYSACFNSALEAVMLHQKIKAASAVTATVSLYQKDALDYVLGVEIEGHIDGVPLEQAEELMRTANQVCPYSKATQGNIEVTVKAV